MVITLDLEGLSPHSSEAEALQYAKALGLKWDRLGKDGDVVLTGPWGTGKIVPDSWPQYPGITPAGARLALAAVQMGAKLLAPLEVRCRSCGLRISAVAVRPICGKCASDLLK